MPETNNTKPKAPAIVLIVAILAVVGLEALALHKGIDGAYFALSLALVGALAGIKLRDWLPRK